MSEKRHKPAEEEGGGEVGLWYVSFADMITLLLAFFVTLSTFSSYDKNSIKRIQAVSPKRYPSAISGLRETGRNSLVDPRTDYPLRTFGDPTGGEGTTGVWPQTPPHPGTFATRQRKSVRMPLSELFHGDTAALSPAGAQSLTLLGRYLSQTPYCVHLWVHGTEERMLTSRQYQAAAQLARMGVDWAKIGLAAPRIDAGDERPELVLTFLPGGSLQ
jgi:hypothetical protein